MRAYRLTGVVLICTSFFCSVKAQQNVLPPVDSLADPVPVTRFNLNQSELPGLSARSLVLPGLMIAYGATAIESDGLKGVNEEVKEEVWVEHPHQRFHLDNYLQFAPAVAVYGLNLAGIKGKHNLLDRSMIYGISNLILTGTVNIVKNATVQQRPDGSAYNSFPSGHTAEAFASAEFLRQEYKDVSPWYGIAGYAMAVTTGYLRMYNNKHWLSDVVAGAGVGIVSTRLAYWLYPKIQQVFSKHKPVHTMIMPSYQSGSIGLGMIHTF
jgi:hypothetical protein